MIWLNLSDFLLILTTITTIFNNLIIIICIYIIYLICHVFSFLHFCCVLFLLVVVVVVIIAFSQLWYIYNIQYNYITTTTTNDNNKKYGRFCHYNNCFSRFFSDVFISNYFKLNSIYVILCYLLYIVVVDFY